MNIAILQQCTPPPGTSLPGGLFTSISFEEPEKGVIESFIYAGFAAKSIETETTA